MFLSLAISAIHCVIDLACLLRYFLKRWLQVTSTGSGWCLDTMPTVAKHIGPWIMAKSLLASYMGYMQEDEIRAVYQDDTTVSYRAFFGGDWPRPLDLRRGTVIKEDQAWASLLESRVYPA